MPTPQIKQVMPPFFMIRIPKQAQRERLEKIGVLYYPPEFTFMKRGMQCGEIVAIGTKAHEYFPQAKVGHILIIHHIAEGKETANKKKFFFIDQDENWNYYIVTAFEHNGDRNMAFGVWDGENLIPNKDYIFLEVQKSVESEMEDFDLPVAGLPNFVTNISFKQAGHGIVIAKERTKTREELTTKMNDNTEKIKKLSRWLQFPDMFERVAPEIKSLERENEKMSKQINTVVSECHTVAAANPELDILPGDSIYTLNIACYMQVEFMGKEYIISETKYMNALL